VKREDFTAWVGDRFALEVAGRCEGHSEADTEAPAELELVEVVALETRSGQPAPARSEPFSCLFRGPAERSLPQGTHTLVHSALGRRALFLVPVGPVDGGVAYEAVFA